MFNPLLVSQPSLHGAKTFVVTNDNVGTLKAADFVTPASYPNPLYVKPPMVPAHLRRPTSRWSEAQYCNPAVPSYVPPEMLLFGDGRVIDAFLMRARLEDMRRLTDRGLESLYFMRRGGELPPDFRGSAAEELHAQREMRLKEFENAAKRYEAEDLGAAGNKDPARKNRLEHKIFFTDDQMRTGVFGALFGYRGATQKMLQNELKCKLIVGGRGITDPSKIRPDIMPHEEAVKLAAEEPHCKISAGSEILLKQAVQRIEHFLSNDADAVRERETLSRRGEVENGVRFRGNRYTKANAVREAAENAARAAGRIPGVAATNDGGAYGGGAGDDADVRDLLSELL